jgi:response regulator RpfG family c-di-GMP phosphodiesterase
MKDRGTHIVPVVVDAFLRCETEFKKIATRFADYKSVAA